MPTSGPTPTLRQRVYDRDRMRCRYCGRDVIAESFGQRRATIDHVIPRSRFFVSNGGPGRGAANTLGNMVTACWLCNHTKNDRTPEEAGMTLLPAPDGSEPPAPKVPQPKKAKTGTRYGTRQPPPRLTYRTRLLADLESTVSRGSVLVPGRDPDGRPIWVHPTDAWRSR